MRNYSDVPLVLAFLPFFSLSEYMADLWSGEGKKPKWLIAEEDTFVKTRDQNSDGVMDQSEVRDWIFPREKEIKDQVILLMRVQLRIGGKSCWF